jgi:soluble lytic murein transglycosylase-like protein
MSAPAIQAVGVRIREIQGTFRRNLPTRSTFAAALAQAEAGPQESFQVASLGMPATSTTSSVPAVPVGILGTPIITQTHPFLGGVGDSWRELLPAAGREWADEIEAAANQAGVDPRLLAALVWQESGFNESAVSKSGAIGLAQLMPATAEGLGVDPWDAAENLGGGARYLAWTIAEFGSVDLGLAAYNAGPGRVREAGGIPNIAETQAYVPRVLDYYRQLGGVA